MNNFDFEVHIDTVDTFDSVNLKVITRGILEDEESIFQNGPFIKGITVDLGEELEETENKTIYWKVKIIYPYETDINFSGIYESNFSQVQSFVLEKSRTQEIAENLLVVIPDKNVYNKEILHKEKLERNTVLWNILSVYAEEFDKAYKEAYRLGRDNYLNDVREKAIYNNFGTFFGLQKTIKWEWVEYRELIRTFIKAALVGGTMAALGRALEVITGAYPKIRTLKGDPGWLLDFDILAKDTDDTGDLDYAGNIPSPTVLFVTEEYAFTIIIDVLNPFQLELDEEFIREVIFLFIPAHVKVYIRYLSDLRTLFTFGKYDQSKYDQALYT